MVLSGREEVEEEVLNVWYCCNHPSQSSVAYEVMESLKLYCTLFDVSNIF